MPTGVYQHKLKTEEWKRRMSLRFKGIPLSEDHRKKISLALKGSKGTSGSFKKGHKGYKSLLGKKNPLISGEKHYNWKGGLSTGTMYRKWAGLKSRCGNKNDARYKWYGARGIKVEWNTFLDFYNDMNESYENHKKIYGQKNTTLDRINFDGNYSKNNCRWATWKEQGNNKRKFLGVWWNKGTHLSEERKQRLRIINLGKHATEETKQKMRQAQLGKHLSEDHKRKIGESNKKRFVAH